MRRRSPTSAGERRKARRSAKRPLPQALPRPQPLPATRTRSATGHLTNIEASLAQPNVSTHVPTPRPGSSAPVVHHEDPALSVGTEQTCDPLHILGAAVEHLPAAPE